MLPAITLATALVTSTSGASSDAADRALLLSEGPGSLAKPQPIRTIAQVDAICARLAPPRKNPFESADAPSAPPRPAYHVRVGAQGFSVRGDAPLALDLARGLYALDGDLALFSVDRSAGRFDLSETEAEGVRAKIRSGRVAVDLSFRIAAPAHGLSPCAGHPRTEGRRVMIEPLALSLVQIEPEAELARVRTEALATLKARLDPGPAELAVTVRGLDAPKHTILVRTAIRGSAEVQACLQPVIDSPHQTGFAAFTVTKSRQGQLLGVHPQVVSFESPEVVGCLAKALQTVRGPRGDARLSVQIAVERGAE